MNLGNLWNVLIVMQSLRHKLLQGNGKAYGPFLLSASPNIAELLANTGYDILFVDMEHSPTDISNMVSTLRAIDSASRSKFPVQNFPIVRAPTHDDAAMTKRILDILRPPAGIMFPLIENAQQAEKAVASTRYPCHYKNGSGIRGCAHPFVRASQFGGNEEYFDVDSNQDLLTILQVETEEGVNNIPEIGMVEGVDVIFLGPFDISCSLGEMGNFEEDGRVMGLIRRAENLVRDTSAEKKRLNGIGLCLGGFRSPGRDLKEMFSDDVGYQLIAGSVDLGLLKAAAASDLALGRDAMR